MAPMPFGPGEKKERATPQSDTGLVRVCDFVTFYHGCPGGSSLKRTVTNRVVHILDYSVHGILCTIHERTTQRF